MTDPDVDPKADHERDPEPSPPTGPDPAVSPSAPEESVRTLAMVCHLLSFAGFVVPFGHVIGPLVLWLVKREEHPFIDEHGREVVNFQITVTLAIAGCILLFFLVLPLALIPVIAILDLVFTIIAALRAHEGRSYRYPFTLRLV